MRSWILIALVSCTGAKDAAGDDTSTVPTLATGTVATTDSGTTPTGTNTTPGTTPVDCSDDLRFAGCTSLWTSRDFGDTLAEEYDGQGNRIDFQTLNSGVPLMHQVITRHPDGRIAQVQIDAGGAPDGVFEETHDYVYDASDRLIGITETTTSQPTCTWTYTHLDADADYDEAVYECGGVPEWTSRHTGDPAVPNHMTEQIADMDADGVDDIHSTWTWDPVTSIQTWSHGDFGMPPYRIIEQHYTNGCLMIDDAWQDTGPVIEWTNEYSYDAASRPTGWVSRNSAGTEIDRMDVAWTCGP